MSLSRKRAYESTDDSGEKETATPDAQLAPSNQRGFAEVWKKTTRNPVRAILLTAKVVYVGDHDKIIVYDTVTMQEIREIAPSGGYIWDISQSRDEKSLFVAGRDGTVWIIDPDTGEEEAILRGHTDAVRCIIQGEGTDVLTCSYDNTIRRWNSLTGECLKIYEGHTGWVFSILYDEATKQIFSASSDKTIIVWNSETGEKIGVMEGHRDWVGSLTRVNSTTIASGSYDDTIKLWSMATLACIKTISNGSNASSVTVTPDGQHLISGSSDYKVNVWSVATGQCLHTLSHPTYLVSKAVVSPDGRFIATCGFDNKFHLFGVSPSFSFPIRESILVHDGREKPTSLFSDGAVYSNGDLIATVTATPPCSLVSDKQVVIDDNGLVEFVAPSASAAQLWSEAISAVAANLALHPEGRAHSADQMISRYRFTLLQAILVHLREPDTLNWHVPREIVQVIGGYIT
jgi:WD40 repeat protein